MSTRIPLAPARPVALGLSPLPTKVPRTGLPQRLAASARRSLPGWTFRVTVRVWTHDLVVVLIDGTRNPASGAPAAPPPDSAAAAQLKSLTAEVLETFLETVHPGSHWFVFPDYRRLNADAIELTLVALRKKDDPPTCADGAVIFPGDTYLEDSTGNIVIRNTGIAQGHKKPVARYVFFHRFAGPLSSASSPSPVPTPNASYTANGWPAASPPINPPTLVHQNNPVSYAPQKTYAHLLAANASLPLNPTPLSDWWVWWDPVST